MFLPDFEQLEGSMFFSECGRPFPCRLTLFTVRDLGVELHLCMWSANQLLHALPWLLQEVPGDRIFHDSFANCSACSSHCCFWCADLGHRTKLQDVVVVHAVLAGPVVDSVYFMEVSGEH